MEGIEVLKNLRVWYPRPILILSVRNEETKIVEALDAGADDYITKPFHTSELLARIRVSLRNSPASQAGEPVFEVENLKIDFGSRQVTVSEQEVKLTSTEYELMRLLVKHAGKVLTHRQILREVWGPNATQQNQYLRVYVNHLRRKLEAAGAQSKWILTESGVGYRFRAIHP